MRLYFARKLFFIFFMSPLLCFFISPLCVAETVCVWVVFGEWVRKWTGRGCGFEVGSGLRSNCAAAVRLPNRVY